MDEDLTDQIVDQRQKVTEIRYRLVEPTLFVTDAELIRRIGVPEKIGYAALRLLDKAPGSVFHRSKRCGEKCRYWPAVRAWFDRQYIGSRLSSR
jgi:hypothetical protein